MRLRWVWMLWAVLGAMIAVLVPCAQGQGGGDMTEMGAHEVDIDAAGLDGRSFSGVMLPLEPLDGPIVLSAMKATIWTEGAVGGKITSRLLLESDVKVQLGLFKFVAERATVLFR